MMTERERWWLTATVWMEARGEPGLGQQAVAHVILNRLASLRWGDTVGAVVLAPLQFSAWNSESPTRRALGRLDEVIDGSWHDVLSSCVRAIQAGAGNDPTGGARHYYNPEGAHPAWDAEKALPRVTIGRHVFVRNVP